MADETTKPTAPPDSIQIPTEEPSLPSIPIDLNPEYDPAKDKRAAFLKINPNPKGPTVEPAPEPSVLERAKKVVTEGIPQFSTRTIENPKFGQEGFLAPEEALTPAERRAHPAATGALEAIGGMTSPGTFATVGATAGLGEAGIIPKVLSGLFAGQIAASVYDQYPALKAQIDKAQHAKNKQEFDDAFGESQRLLTHMGVDTVMGLLAAKHGAEGAKEILDSTTGSGVPDQESTFKNPNPAEPAQEPEETHPEMNRDTVKQLQKLGYSNQHITNFNIGEIRDILKNRTPAAEHPVSKTPAPVAGPDPDLFAEAGGKLVSQPAPVSTEAETSAATETPADPIEDLLMSDKIGAKKVRGATSKVETNIVTQRSGELPRGLVERTTGNAQADAAIKAAGAFPAGITLGMVSFHDPETGSTLSLRPGTEVTPEVVQQHLAASRKAFGIAPDPDALAEAGGKFVGEHPTTAPVYHPDLQKMVAAEGTSTDPDNLRYGPAFLTPDGKFIHLGIGETHDAAIDRVLGKNKYPNEDDNRIPFLRETGAVRLRSERGRRGDTLAVSVPATGMTPDQITALKSAISPVLGRTGNLVMEIGEKTGASTDREFVKPADIEPMAQEIGAHPDQQDLISKELQTPHKETYGMEVTDAEGNVQKVPVDAHAPKQALANIVKKFPDAHEWRLDTMPEEKAPSTEYSVPTGKLQKMKESFGRPEIDTIRHELGHVFEGTLAGMKPKGILSSAHPSMPSDARAAVLWDGEGMRTEDGRIKPEKRLALVQASLGAIAADEVFNDVPRSANHNFDIRGGGDGTKAYDLLRDAGYTHQGALDYMHQTIDAAATRLQHPAITSIVHENAGVRETGLSKQFHYSPERLNGMVAEANRRMTDEKYAERRDNGSANGSTREGRQGNVAGGEGGVSKATPTEPAETEEGVESWQPPAGIEKGIPSSAPVDTNIPLTKLSVSPTAYSHASSDNARGKGSKTEGPIRVLYNPDNGQYLVEDGMHRVVEAHQKGKTSIPAKLWSGYSDTVANVHGEKMDLSPDTEEGIVSEDKVKNELPDVAPNAKLQKSANKYAKSIGLPKIDHSPVEADLDRAREIAQQYEASKHSPNDPTVKASYDALKAETLSQFHHLRDDLGLKFKPQEEDPYGSAEEMMDDIRKNNTLKVFTGSSTGPDHPLSEVAPGTGGQTYNTVFRWVHDAMGHAAGGNDFSENGEKSATEAHAQMYSPLARPAMRNETEGQTSWFFHNPEVESGAAQPGKFAEQKAALIHDETTAPKGRSFAPVTPEAHQAAVSVNPHGVSMSDVDPNGASYQMQVDGKPVPVFYSINPDGEIAGVVNNSKGAIKDAATAVFKDAAKHGGTYLTAWDVNDRLPSIYRKQGFEVVSRTPYDEKTYGPPTKDLQDSWKAGGWKPGEEYPSVVRMEPKASDPIIQKIHDLYVGVPPEEYQVFKPGEASAKDVDPVKSVMLPTGHIVGEPDAAEHDNLNPDIIDPIENIRIAAHDSFQLDAKPTDEQRAEMARLAGRGKVYWDFRAATGKTQSGEGSVGDLQRAIDQHYGTGTKSQASDHTVSTRVPTGKVKGQVVEDHTDQSRLSDMDAAKAAPGYVQKMVNRTNETPGFSAPDATAQEQADAYIRHAADNIKFVNSKISPEEFQRDSQWYPVGAHERGQEVATTHGVTPHQAYAVTAVESPMTDWDQNTSLAERTINIWKNQQNTVFTPEMQAAANKITSLPANKAFKPYYKKLQGKTLGELPDTRLQAHWLRLYDEAHNPRSYETWGPDGKSRGIAKNQDGSEKKVGWSFQSHIEKAIEILKDGSDENISKRLGYGHKVRNFYNNQVAPDDPRYLTMDTHAINVAQLRPMSGKTKAVRENFGTVKNGPNGLSGTYPMHDAAYRLAAKELHIDIPSRLQSPTWVKIRDVFTDDFKTPENQDAIDAIWKEHEDGKIKADEARNRIWDYAVRWNRENAARNGAASDQGQLFEGGVHGESSGGAAGRGTGSGAAGEVPESIDDDISFDFGANVKPIQPTSRTSPKKSKAAPGMNVFDFINALKGLDKPGKK